MLSNKSKTSSRRRQASEGGFSLLEMVVAMTILSVGMLGVGSAIGYALMATNNGRKITNTKLLVVSVLEQMETLRDTGNLTFGQIANQGSVDNSGSDTVFAGFPVGFQSISTEPGPDGVFGTDDDRIAQGPDGVYGTNDDFTDQSRVIQGVSRQIAITNLSGTLKRIEVTVRFQSNGGHTQEIQGVSYLNDDSHGNYIP
jgi:prepilin-type N-terminal cleavage/methylation domain-containing protein